MRELLLAASLLVATAPGARADPAIYGVGTEPTREEIRALDISVSPTGAGLPAGRGTARQGKMLYDQQCGGCHGPRGEGSVLYPPLAGGLGSIKTAAPLLTVGSYWPYATTVWDYIRRAMPYFEPGTLETNEVYAITAFILYQNGIVEFDVVLDESTLASIRMPNRHGFVPDPRPDVRMPRNRR